jgi:hypothetical protein
MRAYFSKIQGMQQLDSLFQPKSVLPNHERKREIARVMSPWTSRVPIYSV